VIETIPFHQMVSGSPIAMAVEHGACDASAQHPRKCLLVTLGLPVSNNFIASRKAANVQALLVCWTTAKTFEAWRVGFLDAFLGHCYFLIDVYIRIRNQVRLDLTAAFSSADEADYTDSRWNSNSILQKVFHAAVYTFSFVRVICLICG
jgi:hypothetical protein